MCEYCFNYNIEFFESYQDYDILVTNPNFVKLRKVSQIPDEWTKPKFQIFGISIGGSKKRGYSLYECNKCKKKWMLSEPENAWRGYFKMDE